MPKATHGPVRPAQRMASYRRRMRAAGLRPLQIWAPDTHAPEFAEICRRQAEIVAKAERNDADLQGFTDAALADLDRPTQQGVERRPSENDGL